MSFTLRPYQEDFVTQIRKLLNIKQRIIACAATGSGKTKTFIAIAKMAIERGRTVLIITESTKIFQQIEKETQCITINPKKRSFYPVPQNKLYLAMAQTLMRRPIIMQGLQQIGKHLLIINDEAHIGTATNILLDLPDAYIIGFTATPDYETSEHLPEIYSDIVVGPQPLYLVNEGYLASYTHKARVTPDIDQLKLKNGEFSEVSQNKVFGSQLVFDGLVEDLKIVPYNKCLIYTPSIEECDLKTEQLRKAGFICVRVHSKNPTSDIDLAEFMEGNVNICVSVAILTKGFDFPQIDLIVLLRKTTSLPLFLQMCGRGSRISKGKLGFTVLDYGENWKKHGLWIWERDWENMWRPVKEKVEKKDVAAVKMCPMCQAIVPASSRECPYCGFVWEGNVKEKAEAPESKLVDITEQFSKLKGKYILDLTPEELALYVRQTNNKQFGIKVAKSHEQSTNGWLQQYATIMGYKQSFVWMMKRDMDQHDYGKILIKNFVIR